MISLIKNIEQIYDNTQYLRFGLTRFNMQNLTPFTISVRKMFLDFFLSQKTLIDRAEEIIENLEFKSVTPEGKQKLATKNMLREQLEQLKLLIGEKEYEEKVKEDAKRVFDAKKRIFRAGIGFLKNDIFAKGGV